MEQVATFEEVQDARNYLYEVSVHSTVLPFMPQLILHATVFQHLALWRRPLDISSCLVVEAFAQCMIWSMGLHRSSKGMAGVEKPLKWPLMLF